jgi:type IX secretion system PorP/SprF family membrane protein
MNTFFKNKKNLFCLILCRIGLFLAIGIIQCSVIWAQNVSFSQYQLAPVQSNPAFILNSNQTRVIFNYRSQEIAAGQSYVSPMISVIHPWISKKTTRKGAFALSFLQDKTGEGGILTTNGGLATFASNFNLSPSSLKSHHIYLGVGVQGGYFQRRVNPDALTWASAWNGTIYNPLEPINEDLLSANTAFPIFNAGTTLYLADSCANVKGFLGVNIQNLNRPNVGFFGSKVQQPMFMSIMAGYNVYDRNNITIQPNVRWVRESQTNQIRAGVLAYYKFANASGALEDGNIGLGAWYDENGAAIASLEFNQKNFFAGFSYDLGATSNIKTLGNAAMELSIGLKFGKKCLGNRTPKEKELIPDTLRPEVKNEDGVIKYTIVAWLDGKEVVRTDTIQRDFLPNVVDNAVPTEEELKILKKQGFFYYLSEDISRATSGLLDQVAVLMNKYKRIRIEIIGHTCDIGNDNQTLSVSRAKRVQKYLTDKGVDIKRLEISGVGDTQPVLSNKTEYGRTKNRRVEFKLLDGKGQN